MTHTDPHRESQAEGLAKYDWVLVPREPTEAMRSAGRGALWNHLRPRPEAGERGINVTLWPYGCETNALLGYRAMLAASPRPDPVPGPTRGEVTDIRRRAEEHFQSRLVFTGHDCVTVMVQFAEREIASALSAARTDTPSSRDPVQGVLSAMAAEERLRREVAEKALPFEISKWLTTISAHCLCIRDGENVADLADCVDGNLADLAEQIVAALAASDRAPADDGWGPNREAVAQALASHYAKMTDRGSDYQPSAAPVSMDVWLGYADAVLPTPPVEPQPIRSTETEDGR